MSLTMPGEDEEEKKANASKTSIECVERFGKYNPLRARPVKVRFGNKTDADYVLKQRKKLPKGVVTKNTAKQLNMREDYYVQSSKLQEG